jgi:inner membrane protein
VTSKTHNLAALASLITVAVVVPPTELNWISIILVLVANVVGSLLPDIDQASNRLWDLLPAGNVVGKYFRHIFLYHRTISHSILGIFVVYKLSLGLFARIFNPEYINIVPVWGSLMIGYISHLAADGLTDGGLPLLFPWKLKFGFPPVRSWRMKTGKWFENYVVFPGLLLCVMYLMYSQRHRLIAWLPL